MFRERLREEIPWPAFFTTKSSSQVVTEIFQRLSPGEKKIIIANN